MPAAIISKNAAVPSWNHNAAAPSTASAPMSAALQTMIEATLP